MAPTWQAAIQMRMKFQSWFLLVVEAPAPLQIWTGVPSGVHLLNPKKSQIVSSMSNTLIGIILDRVCIEKKKGRDEGKEHRHTRL